MNELIFILTFNKTSTVVTLSHAPGGWNESLIKFERSAKYYGMFRSFTIPLKFHKSDAACIREEFYTYGLDSDVTIQIQKLNRLTLVYFTAYSGKLDFSTYKDDNIGVECNFIDSGLTEYLKKDGGTEFDISTSQYWPDLIKPIFLCHKGEDRFIRCLSMIEMGQMLLDKITGQTPATRVLKIVSTFLSSKEFTYMITCGKSIRRYEISYTGIPVDEGGIKTTFEDWFAAIDNAFCLGAGIEVVGGIETLRIEPRSYFFSESEIINVGEVSKLELSVIGNFNIKRIKVGWPEKQYNDEFLKLNEPNTECQWNTPNMAAGAKEYDIVNKYRADWQAIELIINEWGADVDDSDDEELFFINTVWYASPDEAEIVLMDETGKLYKTDNLGTPFIEPLYNAKLSPRRMLQNHLLFISSCLFGFAGENITFTSGKNDEPKNVVYAYDGFDFFEGEPTEISDDVYFYPIQAAIEAPYPANMMQLIEAKPNGYISFMYENETYKGFIQSMDVKLAGRSSSDYKLILTPDNDLTKLIR